MTLIFFHWKVRLYTFWIFMFADTSADSGREILIWNFKHFPKFSKAIPYWKCKYLPRCPHKCPQVNIVEKYRISPFTGKKINLIAFLDRSIDYCEVEWLKGGFTHHFKILWIVGVNHYSKNSEMMSEPPFESFNFTIIDRTI